MRSRRDGAHVYARGTAVFAVERALSRDGRERYRATSPFYAAGDERYRAKRARFAVDRACHRT